MEFGLHVLRNAYMYVPSPSFPSPFLSLLFFYYFINDIPLAKNLFEGLTPQAAFANVLRWREILQELESTAESQMSKCAWDLIKKYALLLT